MQKFPQISFKFSSSRIANQVVELKMVGVDFISKNFEIFFSAILIFIETV